MALFSQNQQSEVYCAFCRSRRKVYKKKSVDAVTFGGLLLLSLTIMFLLTHHFDPRVIVFFAFSLILCEAVIRFRWRLAMICRHCGFDPIVYLKSPEQAAQKVKERLAARRDSVDSIFLPPLQLPVKKVRKDQRPGSHVSRQA